MVRFSHKYTKMPEGWEKSRLLQVLEADEAELSHEFICYDTHIEGGGHYQLPEGHLIILILETVEKGDIWTTIRRFTPSKYFWYRSQMGYELGMRLIE